MLVAQAFLPVFVQIRFASVAKNHTGKNACATKSSFLCAPRRFFASVGQTIGFRRLPCAGQKPQKKRSSAPLVFAAKPRCATRQHGAAMLVPSLRLLWAAALLGVPAATLAGLVPQLAASCGW